MDNLERLEGRVTAVLFANVDNGYTVMKLDCDTDEPVTVVGCIPYASPGEYFELYGSWVEHRSYGQQFKAVSFDRWLPQDLEGMKDFLSSGVIDGVGEATAERIVERFGEESFDIIAQFPERLEQIRGITPARAVKMSKAFNERMEMRRLLEFVASNGLSQEVGLRIYRRYGTISMKNITENPYLLVDDFFGVSFPVADAFARNMGLADDSPLRFEAAISYVLLHNLTNGHVFIPAGKLCAAAAGMVGFEDPESMLPPLERLVESQRIVRETIAHEDACYLASMFEAEAGVAGRLYKMSRRPFRRINPKDIDKAQRESGIEYSERQLEAITKGAACPVMVMTGGPGTGKTTTIRAIISVCQSMELDVKLAAPTGRAAKRMTDVCGMEAKTIHRLLETQMSDDMASTIFTRDADNPIDADVLIVDELSMVDITLMAALLEALPPKASLVLVGDPDQIPSVGPGNVLKDIIASGIVQTVHLDTIFRQAQKSRIIMNAHAINAGTVPELKSEADFFYMRRNTGANIASTIVELCSDRLPKFFNIDKSQIQVLTPSKKQEGGSVSLNKKLQAALNPPMPGKAEITIGDRTFRTGDRVMQMRNDYDIVCSYADGRNETIGVYNGDIANIIAIDNSSQTITLKFEDDRIAAYTPELMNEVELAYAITVHKSQGCEFPVVVFSAFDADPRLLSRNILYTAVTRAKNQLVIVGRDDVVVKMVANNVQHKRYSALHLRLRELANSDRA